MNITKIENSADRPVLTTPAHHIPTNIAQLKTYLPFIQDLITQHRQLGGVGLAATQVGVSLPIVIAEVTELQAKLRDNAQPFALHVFINPHYIGVGENNVTDLEGCFSVDTVAGWVPRYAKIKLTAVHYNPETQKFALLKNKIYSGFIARVIQHETDHINGVLITDRLTSDCLQGSIPDMYRLRRERLSDEKRVLLDQLLKSKNT